MPEMPLRHSLGLKTLYQGFCQQNNRKLLRVPKFKFSQEMEGS